MPNTRAALFALAATVALCLAGSITPARANIDMALNTSNFVAGQASTLSVDGIITAGGGASAISAATIKLRFNPLKVTLSNFTAPSGSGWSVMAYNLDHASEGWAIAVVLNLAGQTVDGPMLLFTVTPANSSVVVNDCVTLTLSAAESDMADGDCNTVYPSDPCAGPLAPVVNPPETPKKGGGPLGPMSPGMSAGKGDVNGDGVVDIRDAVLALRITVGKDIPSADTRARADIYPFDGQDIGDGQITVDDVKTILSVAAGFTMQPGVTPTPSDLRVAATGMDVDGNIKITLYWIGLPGAAAYNIYRAETAGGENYSSPIATVPAAAPNHSYSGSPYFWYTDADAAKTDGKVYYYTVRAVTANGLTAPSDEEDVAADSGGVPWETRDPSQIIGPFLNRIRLDPDYPTGPVRIAGPDQTIYDSESATALPPEGTYDAGTNTYTLNSGDSFSLPGDRGPTEGLGPMVAALPPSKGPYRGVRSDTGFTGISVTVAVPPPSEIHMGSLPPDAGSVDTAYVYLGSGSSSVEQGAKTSEVDAGLQYSSLNHNWATFISQGGSFRTLGGFALAQHRVAATNPNSTLFHMRYYAAPAPYSDAYLLTAAWYNAETGEVSPQSVGVFAKRDRSLPIRMKRVVAIAQKGIGVRDTGSHFGTSLGLGTAFSDPNLMRGTRETLWDDSHAPSSLNGVYTGPFDDATIAYLGPVENEHNITIAIKDASQ